MSEIYDGLPDTQLTYVTQSISTTKRQSVFLAEYTDSGFSGFKSTRDTNFNNQSTSNFPGKTITSNYNKAVIEYLSLGPNEDEDDETIELYNYLIKTNQKIPTSLIKVIEDSTTIKEGLNSHANTIIPKEGPITVTTNKGTITVLSHSDSVYYGYNGSVGTWTRHGNFSASQPHYDYTHYDYTHYDHYDHSDSSHSDSSHYDYSHSDYSHYDSNHSDSSHYDYSHSDYSHYDYVHSDHTVTYPTKEITNYTPTKPEAYVKEILDDMQQSVTLGYHSYDRNVKTGNIGLSGIKYKIELAKLTGPNQRGFQIIQDSSSDTITINPKNPFNVGWTGTTEGYGSYQMKITPYNAAATVDEDGWSFNAPQLNGEPLVLNFYIAVNTKPTVEAGSGSPIIGSTLFMDGAIQGGVSKDYAAFYGPNVPSTKRKGLYMVINVLEPDEKQYLKGSVILKDRATGASKMTVPIIWENGTDTIMSQGGENTGYIFMSSESLHKHKFNGELEVVVTDYYDSACEVPTLTSSVRQNYVGRGNTTMLVTDINMQKTLNYDKVGIVQSNDITKASQVEMNINNQPHLRDSLKSVKVGWSFRPSIEPLNYVEIQSKNGLYSSNTPPTSGIWYMHTTIEDKYGSYLKEITGPLYFSTVQLKEGKPYTTHFDHSDSIRLGANATSWPDIPLTYTHRFGIKKANTPDSTYVWTPWRASDEHLASNIKMYEGLWQEGQTIVSEIHIKENNQYVRSPETVVDLSHKLAWNVRNQRESMFNLESISRHVDDIHNSSGQIADGFQLMTSLSPDLQATLRPKEYFYYKKDLLNKYWFQKIIYVGNPVEN